MLEQEASLLFLMLQHFSEVRSTCPIWHKLVCFALFFNAGIFHKTASVKAAWAFVPENSHLDLHPSPNVFVTFSASPCCYSLVHLCWIRELLRTFVPRIKYCNCNWFYLNLDVEQTNRNRFPKVMAWGRAQKALCQSWTAPSSFTP